MKIGMDFLQMLEMDVSLHIMNFIDDPADLVRASAVSHFWHKFVTVNELGKRLCFRTFPEMASLIGVVNTSKEMVNPVEVECNSEEWVVRKRDQQLYASLLNALTKSEVYSKDFITHAVSATSTDNYLVESVVHTLNPKDKLGDDRPSYWSSKGQSNPDVPETLIYKLHEGMWLLMGVDLQPFEAYFQPGRPIYSAKSVRFRYGHPNSPEEFKNPKQFPFDKPADDKFVWTYTSPEFPMLQNNELQEFTLPEPVVCVGGYLQIELLGRVQQQETDDLFYICMCYARAAGRPMYPAFKIEKAEPDGKPSLTYYPNNLNAVMTDISCGKSPHLCTLEEEMLLERIHVLEDLFRRLQGGFFNLNGEEVEDDGSDEYLLQVIHQVIRNRDRLEMEEAEETDDEEMD